MHRKRLYFASWLLLLGNSSHGCCWGSLNRIEALLGILTWKKQFNLGSYRSLKLCSSMRCPSPITRDLDMPRRTRFQAFTPFTSHARSRDLGDLNFVGPCSF